MIVSLSGLIGSGKNAVAEYLVNEHGFIQESFAGALKDAVSSIFGWDRTMLEGSTKDARVEREKVDQWWATRLDIPHLSPRWVLQNFGTECCRKHFHDDIWLASLEHRLLAANGKDIVISDSRFVNELRMLRSLSGILVVVRRGELPDWWQTATQVHFDPMAMEKMKLSAIHQSEWDWAGFDFDYQIGNYGTLDQLYSVTNDLIINNRQ